MICCFLAICWVAITNIATFVTRRLFNPAFRAVDVPKSFKA